MPYRKKYRKRRRRRKRKRRNKLSVLRVPGIMIPDTTYVKLKVNGMFPFNLAGDGTVHIVAGNAAFDPFLTVGAQQPSGFNQWAEFYSLYQVMGSRLTVKCQNLVSNPFRFAICPRATGSTPGITTLIEQPYTKYCIVGDPGSSKATRQLSKYMGTKKIFGRTIASVNYTANTSANPASLWEWLIRTEGMKVTSSPATDLSYSLSITLILHLKFWDRKFAID